VSPQPRKRQPAAGSATAKRPRSAAAKKAQPERAGPPKAPKARKGAARPAEPLPVAALATPPPSAAAAAEQASDIVAQVGTAAAPVRVSSVHPLETGLVDYGLWVELFARMPPPPVPSGPFRRGRIWA
jgi:cyanobactin cluster PatC/TenC/TruC protein